MTRATSSLRCVALVAPLALSDSACTSGSGAAAGASRLDAATDSGAGRSGGDGGAGSGGASSGGTSNGGTSNGGTSNGGTSNGGGSGGVTGSGGAIDGGAGARDSGGPGAAPSVLVVGRAEGPSTARKFSWSGVSVQARFSGTDVSADLDGGDNNFFEVVIDGTPRAPVGTSAGRKLVPLATGLAPGPHELVLWRRTEANNSSPTTFYGLDLAGGTLLPIPPKPHKLEVIGDSITCGYGDLAPNPCTFSYDTENDYAAYGSVAARALSADLYTECWSGKGMIRTYDGSTAEPFPAVYPRAIATEASSAWDFSWIPDAVVVNLGTNDFAKGDPGPAFVTAYETFVTMLRGHYPNAFLFLTVGPMLYGSSLTQARAYLDQVIQARKGQGDSRLSQILLETQDQANGIGCDYHPSAATHAIVGKIVADAIAAQLGW